MDKATCTKCGQEKLLEDFCNDRSKAKGRTSACKQCINERSKRYYYANHEKAKARCRAYQSQRTPTPESRYAVYQPRTCATCDSEYTPKRKDQRHCGKQCRNAERHKKRKRRIHQQVCPRCGVQFLGDGKQRHCSKRCGAKRNELIGPVPRRALNVIVIPGASHARDRTWTMGYCAECDTPYVDSRKQARYCGDRCAKRAGRRAGKQARNKLIKDGSQRERISLAKVAMRDGWRCHICKRKVTRKTWSLDHLVPLSHGGDHTYANVALAHHLCNTRRSNTGSAQLLLVA